MPQPVACTKCGATLPANSPPGSCPRCLLHLGMASGSVGVASQADDAGASGLAVTVAHDPQAGENQPAAPPPGALPEPGQRYGDYLIVRILGRGGMGAVYEAEQLETGRRVALKVLKHSLDSPEARKRFLREGRLAASVNHPNSVYVYGTEEIAGTPAISMELVAGGTLQDRVKREGPLPIGEAVDAVLQIIAGLEAAQRLGVLHRDIKPANCFFDADGAVKVGDFGLSISTAPRGESDITHSTSFLSTPAFASPEQLRGDELNVRSDMYSVGVTLYYLLTGRTPFEADNMVKLLATVLERVPESPKKFRPEIPQGLAQVVLRCLEKQPSERFANYSELREELTPFSSAAPRPAALGLRFAAGAIDRLLLSLLVTIIEVAIWRDNLLAASYAARGVTSTSWLMLAIGVGLWLVYFGTLEGVWGASLGKWVCRLRVVDGQRQPPGVLKAALRTLIVIAPMQALWAMRFVVPPEVYQPAALWIAMVSMSSFLLLFVTARRSNGLAALHDLLTGTRVVYQSAYQARPALTPGNEDLPATQATTIGPYHVLDNLTTGDGDAWILGYDTRLLRRIWIHKLPAGAAAVPAALRNVARAGRLRWLNGRRSATENWDAYEALNGQPLVNLVQHRQPWNAVRFWLLDLAQELDAGLADGTLPKALGLDRVWITGDGRAKLLDFTAPGAKPGRATPDAPVNAPQFLNQVAISALEGRAFDVAEAATRSPARSLPMPARELLDALPTADSVPTARLQPLTEQPVSISRRRRLGVVVACVLPSVIFGGIMLLGWWMLGKFMETGGDATELIANLQQLNSLALGEHPRGKSEPQDIWAMEIYISDKYGRLIADPHAQSNPFLQGILKNEILVEQLNRIRADHPSHTPDEIAWARKRIQPVLDDPTLNLQPGMLHLYPYIGLGITAFSLVFGAALSFICAASVRRGLVLRILGIELVTANGQPASRGRLFWRGLIAWSPILLVPVLLAFLVPLVALAVIDIPSPPAGQTLTEDEASDAHVDALDAHSEVLIKTIAVGSVLVCLVLLVWSLALPQRGLPDRLARTWPVPA